MKKFLIVGAFFLLMLAGILTIAFTLDHIAILEKAKQLVLPSNYVLVVCGIISAVAGAVVGVAALGEL